MSGPLNSDTIRAGAAGASGSAGYQIDQSIRFNKNDDAKLTRTFGTATNRRKFTLSVWQKNGSSAGSMLEYNQSGGSTWANITIGANGRVDIFDYSSGSARIDLRTTRLFRDFSAWVHLVVAFDTTQGTAANRIKVYINGTQETSFGTETYPSQNFDGFLNSAVEHLIGEGVNGPFDGYIAEYYFIDGQQLGPDSFGETNDDGVWIPKDASSLTFGNTGYYLDGSDSSDLGEDFSGNNNDWSSSGLTAADQMSDTPTNNHCTLNPLNKDTDCTLTDGNLQVGWTSGTDPIICGTMGVSSGKWYYEATFTGTFNFPGVGIAPAELSFGGSAFSSGTGTIFYYAPSGNYRGNGDNTSYGAEYFVSSKIGVALNLDDNQITFYKDNSSQGTLNLASIRSGYSTWVPLVTGGGSIENIIVNFGQSDFQYTPPTGFKAWNTSNLPALTIADGSEYFHTQPYTGNGSSGLAITNDANAGDFEPDLLILAPRSNGDNKVWFDDVRGTTKRIKSNSADAGDTDSTAQLTFESDGFDLDTTDVNFNGSGRTYVTWQWKKGATPGFDIVEYTGNKTNRTISHSLGVAPEWIVIKDYSNTESWVVGHNSIGWTKNLFLNLTNAQQTSSSIWQDTAPTSSVFSIGTSDGVNKVGSHIAYLWAPVAGFSKFGSYTGNGNVDGPFVATEFRPAFVMLKRADSADNWVIVDSARNPFNVANLRQLMDTNNADITSTTHDFLSNGFKLRASDGGVNASGGTFVYMAFAENPFGGDGIAAVTAR